MKNSLRLLIRNKAVWQIALALLMIIFLLYFIRNEHLEIKEIHRTLTQAKKGYVLAGLASVLIYIVLQGLMYVFSFRAFHLKVTLRDSMVLFLKRNLISVFLPAGGVSSLAFFTKPLLRKGINKSQIYYASFIYGISGILTVIIIAIPAIILSLKADLSTGTSALFYIVILSVIIFAVLLLLYFVVFRGFGSGLLAGIWPDFLVSLDNLRAYSISLQHFLLVIGFSLLIEVVGVAQLFVGLHAVGIPATLSIALIGYVLMTVFLVVSPFLRGLGAIEVSLTLLFTHYGFTTIEAASGMLLFRFLEFWLPLGCGLLVFLVKPGKMMIRVLPTILLFLLGILNILSAITPALPTRLHLIRDYLPESLINTSGLFVLALGIILLANSYFLLRRLKYAWWIAFILSGLSLIGHLTKGIDYEEAAFAALVMLTLIFTYKDYIFKSVINVSRHFFFITLFLVLAIILFNITGFYLIEKKHFNQDFSLYDSFVALFQTWFFKHTTWTSQTNFASHFLVWIRISGVGLMGILAYGILKPAFRHVLNPTEHFDHAIELVKQYGDSPLDYFKTYMDKMLFCGENHEDGFLAYKIYKGVAVVLENPVSIPGKRAGIIKEFDRFCASRDYLYFVYRIPARDMDIYKSLGMKFLPIGQEATVNLAQFSLEGREMKSLRNGIRKVEKSGFTHAIYHPPVADHILMKLQDVSDEWLSYRKRDELVFSQGLFDQTIVRNTTILTVENDAGEIAGFLNIIPDYKKHEGTYDLIRIVKDAPNGTIDYLIVNMFAYFSSIGLQSANMGMVAITGKEFENRTVSQAFTLLSRWVHKLGDFKGQRDFKEKFKPDWETLYLAYKNDFDLILLPRVLSEIMKPG